MQRPSVGFLFSIVTLVVLASTAAYVTYADNTYIYLPIVQKPESTPTPVPLPTNTPSPTATPSAGMVEFRGLWVTRFDWTNPSQPASVIQAKIDEIVNNAAYAGFNVLLFQVRGEADAFYIPGLEPWSRRLTGTLGQNPGWDPLARLIEKAHAQNIQVHAYLNVYPVWTGCTPPPDATQPRHLYYGLRDYHGVSGDRLNGLQWNTSGEVICSEYQRGTPASVYLDNHLIAVGQDLVTRYNIDGIHLDHIRYAGLTTSCDPVSQSSSGVPCFSSPPADYASYGDWQRAQINGTVTKFYNQVVPLKPGLWLSAAVWPVYHDYWDWGVNSGYGYYYQDSKAWVQGGYIDSISPMIYPATFNCPDNSFWTQSRWQTLVADFQASSGGRYIIPGIGGNYCTFDEIEARINAARALGTSGHAIFSYGGLYTRGYFTALKNGPYAQTAVPPTIPWHP